MIFSGRCHVTQVLRGSRNGTATWNKLARVLSYEELMAALRFANDHLKQKGLRLQPKEQVLKEVADDGKIKPPQFEVVSIADGEAIRVHMPLVGVPRRTTVIASIAS